MNNTDTKRQMPKKTEATSNADADATEQYEIKEGRPVSRFGTLGLFRADKVPEIEPLIIEKPGIEPGYGAIGIGEITSIPTAPAITGAYYKLTGEFQTKLPLHGTPYEKKKK